eukprot:9030664-Pyramimonas_sp.AAC.1
MFILRLGERLFPMRLGTAPRQRQTTYECHPPPGHTNSVRHYRRRQCEDVGSEAKHEVLRKSTHAP